jgi:hypothetical protein
MMAQEKQCSHTELIARVVAIETSVSGLREVLDERDERYKQRAASQDKAVASALETSEKAIIKAESATEKRFDSVNEFRATLADQATRLMPRVEYSVQHEAMVEKVQFVEARLAEVQKELSAIQARGGGLKEAYGYVIALISVVMAGLVLYFKH